jgi:putative hydrolase of the HAD superfamily
VILWDFDGTLAIREGGWTGALGDLLAVHAPDIAATPDQILPFLQAGFPWHEPHIPHTHLNDDSVMWWRALDPIFVNAFEGLGVARKRAVDLARLVRAQYLAPAAWRLFDDALPVLHALAERGWQQMIVSNMRRIAPRLPRRWVSMACLQPFINSATVGY